MPRLRGGSDEISNWQPLCDECNNFKSTACRDCQLDCETCCWAYPEKFKPFHIPGELVKCLREHARSLISAHNLTDGGQFNHCLLEGAESNACLGIADHLQSCDHFRVFISRNSGQSTIGRKGCYDLLHIRFILSGICLGLLSQSCSDIFFGISDGFGFLFRRNFLRRLRYFFCFDCFLLFRWSFRLCHVFCGRVDFTKPCEAVSNGLK